MHADGDDPGVCESDFGCDGNEGIHQFRDGKSIPENYSLQIEDNRNIIGYCSDDFRIIPSASAGEERNIDGSCS